MAYFIFQKNLDNVEGTLYRIAENQSDFNNLNIIDSDYKIIQDSQENFNDVKLNIKKVIKYNGNTIIFSQNFPSFEKKLVMQYYIEECKFQVKRFLDNNPNHVYFNLWNNYYTQLTSFDLDSINYPFEKSLEQHFNDLGQPSYNILQLP